MCNLAMSSVILFYRHNYQTVCLRHRLSKHSEIFLPHRFRKGFNALFLFTQFFLLGFFGFDRFEKMDGLVNLAIYYLSYQQKLILRYLPQNCKV